MTISFDRQDRRVLTVIPPYTPWLLKIDKSEQGIDLVLQVGGCDAVTLLQSKDLPKIDLDRLYEAFSDVIDYVYHRLTERSNEYIDLTQAWRSVWPSDAEVEVERNALDEQNTSAGYSAAYLWHIVLQKLEQNENVSEGEMLAVLSSVHPRLCGNKLILKESSDFRKNILLRKYRYLIQNVLKIYMNQDVEVVIV